MRKLSSILPYFVFVTVVTAFYMHFTFNYMKYFDIGVNDGTRLMDVFLTRTPVVLFFQVAALFFLDKFISRRLNQWRIRLNIMGAFAVVCIVFWGFSIYSQGITREGGFLQFLGYYFLGLEPGRIPSG
ncbi:MAG: hypothetical protein FJZ86_03645 [Chloroflexi bacterium]|nr:hypothetical protein [Chloroflexota bacterium]